MDDQVPGGPARQGELHEFGAAFLAGDVAAHAVSVAQDARSRHVPAYRCCMPEDRS